MNFVASTVFLCNLFKLTTVFLAQPAFYEAFGLTVVEAMTCGLPTFATCHGGPAEIIEHGISGFHIDPYHPEQATNLMVEFFERCHKEPGHWDEISKAGLQRIYERWCFVPCFTLDIQLV